MENLECKLQLSVLAIAGRQNSFALVTSSGYHSQAVMPIVVYAAGILMSTETFKLNVTVNMVVIVTGVLIASHGEHVDGMPIPS